MTQTRDQQRAVFAYSKVREVLEDSSLNDEKTEAYGRLVKNLGTQIRRDGLSAAMAFIERNRGNDEVICLFRHLAEAPIPYIGDGSRAQESPQTVVPSAIRSLSLDKYMLVTRETLEVVKWLKRAVQAEMGDSPSTA